MKYRLKKDLPFAKMGGEVVLGIRGGIDLSQYNDGKVTISVEHIDKLISEGWVEEIEPREYTVGLNKSGIPILIKYKDNTTVTDVDETIEFIKVKEIIE